MVKAERWVLVYVQKLLTVGCNPGGLYETSGWMLGPQKEVMRKHKQFTHQHHGPDLTTAASLLPLSGLSSNWVLHQPGNK